MSSCRHRDANEDRSNSVAHVRVGDVVERQQLLGHGGYEIIAPFRPKPFRALLYERDLFAGQGSWSQLVITVVTDHRLGRFRPGAPARGMADRRRREAAWCAKKETPAKGRMTGASWGGVGWVPWCLSAPAPQ
jgi:hypothetical protein